MTGALLWVALTQFVRVQGTEFVLDDQPFRFVGANLHVMHGASARRLAEETIAAAAADGLRVGRVWALGEGPVGAPAWLKRDVLFRAGPEGWRPEAIAALDRVVALAREHDLRLVVTLGNHWRDYGGIPQYLRWAGHHDVDAYGYRDRFYTDPRARGWYLEHVRRIVERYRDDPTIMAWELFNESHGTPEGAAARLSFIREAARLIKRIDRNHLVSPGLWGYRRGRQREEWIEILSLPEVDYCDAHVYPQDDLRLRGARSLDRFLDDRAQLARHVIKKPLLIGEFGFAGAARARWHRRLLDRLLYDGVNGALVWIYQPYLGEERRYRVPTEQPAHPVRRQLRRAARRFASAPSPRNPILSAARGREPIFPLRAEIQGRAAPHRRWRPRGEALALRIAPGEFWRAEWEEAGIHTDGVLTHAWGAGRGRFDYRFTAPRRVRSLRIRARVSSEYPGKTAPPHGTSRFRILMDGVVVGEFLAPPDDGLGRMVEAAATIEPKPIHTLAFEVPAGPEARGLCVYGEEARLNREPVDGAAPITLVAPPLAPTSR